MKWRERERETEREKERERERELVVYWAYLNFVDLVLVSLTKGHLLYQPTCMYMYMYIQYIVSIQCMNMYMTLNLSTTDAHSEQN